VELSLERPGDHLFVRSVSESGIRVGERTYETSLILSARDLITDWPVALPADLDEDRIEPIFGLEPEVVLLGTGALQVFPDPQLMMCFHRRGVGIEVMTTAAACRTFNVLVSERRNAVAALLPPAARPESHRSRTPG